jgi:hypothetical protein
MKWVPSRSNRAGHKGEKSFIRAGHKWCEEFSLEHSALLPHRFSSSGRMSNEDYEEFIKRSR